MTPADLDAMLRELERKADTVLAHLQVSCLVDAHKLKSACALARLAMEMRSLAYSDYGTPVGTAEKIEAWRARFDALTEGARHES